MENENNAAFSLSAEEMEFCISALQIEMEEVERVMKDSTVTPEEKMEFKTYIQKLDAIQDQFLIENNSFLSVDLLKVYELVQQERDYISDILDHETMELEMRKDGQTHLRTANSIMRKLRKYFKTFEIDV